MEDDTNAELSTNSIVNPTDIVRSSTIIEEGPRICPLCNSIVRQFFINFNEKILMCENTECEFPFGHEDLQFHKENSEVGIDEEVRSISRESWASCSVVTAAEWMDIDKINRAYDSEDTQSDYKAYAAKNYKQLSAKDKEIQAQIKQNIQKIKEINKQLTSEGDEVIGLRNEKWLRHLLEYQETTGVKLLKENEIDMLKEKEPKLGLRELKIDIDKKNTSLSSIKIEIMGPK